MTTRQRIAQWFDQGVKERATYMAVWHDKFDGADGDYPAYYSTQDEAQEEINKPKDDRLMEVYDLRKSKNQQLSLPRCWALRPQKREG